MIRVISAKFTSAQKCLLRVHFLKIKRLNVFLTFIALSLIWGIFIFILTTLLLMCSLLCNCKEFSLGKIVDVRSWFPQFIESFCNITTHYIALLSLSLGYCNGFVYGGYSLLRAPVLSWIHIVQEWTDFRFL